MPSRKPLRAVAHNIGHSLLSVGGSYFIDNTWAVQHVLTAARTAGVTIVTIDLVTGNVTPRSAASAPVLLAVAYLIQHFRDMVNRAGSSVSFVTAATMAINFRLDEKHQGNPPHRSFASHVVVPEMVPYTCNVEIIDDRGRAYRGSPREWWFD